MEPGDPRAGVVERGGPGPQAVRWLPGGQAQTLWPALFARAHDGSAPCWQRERWNTPDGDFVDADWRRDAPGKPVDPRRPLLVLFHGLEGSSRSPYAAAFAQAARERGWDFVLPHFRGCSGELNRAARAYHSGDHLEIDWMLASLRAHRQGPILAVGISLGGNALLRWAQEQQDDAARVVQAAAAVSAPLDLAAAGRAIGAGLNRYLYTPMFLRTMRPKALRKLEQFPGLFDRDRLLAARDLYDFDNVFTAPLHGFRDTDDYWARASSRWRLPDVRIPTLVLNALDDPFVPAASLPQAHEVGSRVHLWQPRRGGHVGFAAGGFPGHVLAMPRAVTGWLAAHH